tara:strand:+ start:25963 stop:26298 length:336 start_codon:yes stop_codon:yes gene_type:complete
MTKTDFDFNEALKFLQMGKAAFELKPVFDCLLANLKTSHKFFMGEIRGPVLYPGRFKTKTGYFWALPVMTGLGTIKGMIRGAGMLRQNRFHHSGWPIVMPLGAVSFCGEYP